MSLSGDRHCTGSCKSNYYTIMATMTPQQYVYVLNIQNRTIFEKIICENTASDLIYYTFTEPANGVLPTTSVSVLTPSVVDYVVDPRLGQTQRLLNWYVLLLR